MLAIFFATGLYGSASAQNLPHLFGINQPATAIGKLKADTITISCSDVTLKAGVACDGNSYAAGCASGICGCYIASCTNAGGILSTGTGSMEIGFDFADGPFLGDSTPDCYPLFGVYTASGKKDSDEEDDFDAIACDPLSGSTAQVAGGWRLVSTKNTSIVNGAAGTLSGTMNISSGALKLSLKGKTF